MAVPELDTEAQRCEKLMVEIKIRLGGVGGFKEDVTAPEEKTLLQEDKESKKPVKEMANKNKMFNIKQQTGEDEDRDG